MTLFFNFNFSLRNLDLAKPGKNTEDDEMAEWLWRKSEEITGVKFEECVPATLLKN